MKSKKLFQDQFITGGQDMPVHSPADGSIWNLADF